MFVEYRRQVPQVEEKNAPGTSLPPQPPRETRGDSAVRDGRGGHPTAPRGALSPRGGGAHKIRIIMLFDNSSYGIQ